MKRKHYHHFVYSVPPYTERHRLEVHDILVARNIVRSILDRTKENYAALDGYRDEGNAIVLTGVRSTAFKHYPVATARRG